ncbi:hypothetical protein ACHAXT_005186 [Thalassiosira profunda]
MPNFFAWGDCLARFFLAILPRRVADRIEQNTSPLHVYVLRSDSTRRDEPRMTPFEGVFATLLFDLALFGTSNVLINALIALFTTLQNSWDRPFRSAGEAEDKVTEFCRRLDIQQVPWIWERPRREYGSLNDFFSRTYAPDHFPKIGEGKLVSPACCKLQCYDGDDALRSILIKGCRYDIARIGLPVEDLEKYRTNRVYLGYLSPKDYHRVHAPIAGRCVHCKLEGVDAPSASVKFFGGKFNLLNENKRLVLVVEEEEAKEGEEPLRVALVIVGGVGVNTITYDDGMVGRRIEKGQEVSTFRAGGSAFALFSTRPLELVEPLKERAADHGVHLEVLVGETLAN